MRTVTTTAYLQIEPVWASYHSSRDNPEAVYSAKVVGLTQKRSKQPRPGTIEIKVSIEIPTGAFVPLQPEATIVIPEGLTIPHPVVVEAADPNEES